MTTTSTTDVSGADARRQEIVSIAAGLLEQTGYARTSMGTIARACGIAKPTLYHYFENKHSILYSIHEEFIDLLLAKYHEHVEAELDTVQLLQALMSDVLSLMKTHRGHVRVFFESHRELPDDLRRQIRVKRRRYEEVVIATIQAGVDTGYFKSETDARLAALAVFGMCNWAYQWYRPESGMGTAEIATAFCGYLTEGIGLPRDSSET
jgi:AcrR family transcriptional regulator